MTSWTHVLVVVGAARPDGDAWAHFGSLRGFNAHLAVAQRLDLVQAAPEPVADDAPEVLLTDTGRAFVHQFQLTGLPAGRANYWNLRHASLIEPAATELARRWETPCAPSVHPLRTEQHDRHRARLVRSAAARGSPGPQRRPLRAANGRRRRTAPRRRRGPDRRPAVHGAGPGGRDRDARRWAAALTVRLLELIAGAARLIPRADSVTEAGAREISRRRLATQSAALRDAAALLQAATADALALEHPDPVAVSLAAMAVQVRAHDTDLRDWSARHPDPADQLLAAHRPADGGEVDGFAAAGTVLGAGTAGTGLAEDAVRAEQDAAPAWARPLVDETATWLLTGYTREASRTTAANALGIPRAGQRWRGAPTRNAAAAPNPLTFLPWCQRAGINPLTGMTRHDRLREWLGAQQAAGVPAGTCKTRLGYVSAFYREMRLRGKTTFEVPAALPRTERGRLGVLRPPVNKPTVAFTLAQVRALRVAARTYRGRGPADTRELVQLRHAAMVDLLTTTGIRADELCSADRGDLRRAGPDGRPTLHVHGKGAKNRWVRITAVALETLDAYLTARDAHETSTEVTVGGKPATTPPLATTSGARLGNEKVARFLKSLCASLLGSRPRAAPRRCGPTPRRCARSRRRSTRTARRTSTPGSPRPTGCTSARSLPTSGTPRSR
jgi:site-specific recombinase XerD